MTIVRRSNGMFPSVFDEFFNKKMYDWDNDYSRRSTLPSVNIKNSESEYGIEVAAPGLSKEDFKVNIDNNVLVISSEKKEEKEDGDGKTYTRKEFSYSNFKRSFTLPEDEVDVDKVNAKYEDGILRITLPKKEEKEIEKVKQVEIM